LPTEAKLLRLVLELNAYRDAGSFRIVPRSDPDKIDINVRCLDGIDVAAISPKLFDGRNWEAAMQSCLPWRQTD
jgi:hypothetical protein